MRIMIESQRIIDRFLEYLNGKGIKLAVAERKMNISNGYLSKQKYSNGTMGGDTLLAMVEAFPDIDVQYIITGFHSPGSTEDGHVHRASIGNYNNISIGSQKDEEIKHLQQIVREKEEQLTNLQKHIQLLEDYIANLKQTQADMKQMFEYLRKQYENADSMSK